MAKSDYPLIPLPDPGEGGELPTFPEDSVPVPPLPDVGEGGPLPDVPEAPQGEPVIPLPNPGEGGAIPTFPGWLPGIIRPAAAEVRFLNAAWGYPGLRIAVERTPRTGLLNYGTLSPYKRVRSGYRLISVTGPDGYVYIRKSLPFRPEGRYTAAVVNRPGGLDLVLISDRSCRPNGAFSNLRMSNLAWGSGSVDMLLADGRTVYADVSFKETTAFKRIRPGTYEFLFADTDQQAMPEGMDVETLDGGFLGLQPLPNTGASVYLKVRGNASYTVFLLRGGSGGQYFAITAEDM